MCCSNSEPSLSGENVVLFFILACDRKCGVDARCLCSFCRLIYKSRVQTNVCRVTKEKTKRRETTSVTRKEHDHNNYSYYVYLVMQLLQPVY